MSKSSFSSIVFVWLLLPATALSGEVLVQVDYKDRTYSLQLSADVQTATDLVYQAMTDYDHLDRLAQAITESREISPDVVQLKLHGCFLLFCFDKIQTQKITASPLTATGVILPEQSDFKSGWTKWTLTPTTTGTHIELETQFVPDFWVPPVIGTYLIQRATRRQALDTVQTLESLSTESDAQGLR